MYSLISPQYVRSMCTGVELEWSRGCATKLSKSRGISHALCPNHLSTCLLTSLIHCTYNVLYSTVQYSNTAHRFWTWRGLTPSAEESPVDRKSNHTPDALPCQGRDGAHDAPQRAGNVTRAHHHLNSRSETRGFFNKYIVVAATKRVF
jgi:hypothetical protein